MRKLQRQRAVQFERDAFAASALLECGEGRRTFDSSSTVSNSTVTVPAPRNAAVRMYSRMRSASSCVANEQSTSKQASTVTPAGTKSFAASSVCRSRRPSREDGSAAASSVTGVLSVGRQRSMAVSIVEGRVTLMAITQYLLGIQKGLCMSSSNPRMVKWPFHPSESTYRVGENATP